MTTANDVQDALDYAEPDMTRPVDMALRALAARIEEVDLYARTMAAAARPGETMTLAEFEAKAAAKDGAKVPDAAFALARELAIELPPVRTSDGCVRWDEERLVRTVRRALARCR